MTNPGGMSYARGLLEKYGWTEGKGLGKTETGMVEALKPKLKFDNTGIGHDHAEQFTFNWWELAFNKAASRISVKTSESAEVEEPAGCVDDLIVTTKRPWIAKLKKDKCLEYGSFIKTETLTNDGKMIPVETKLTPEEEDLSPMTFTSNLSDEELLRICGGRTAHKAARHGHKLVGKLARVTEQEKMILSDVPGEVLTDMESVKLLTDGSARNLKKKKKKKVELVEMFPRSVEAAGGIEVVSRKLKGKERYYAQSSECDPNECVSGKFKRKLKRGILSTEDCETVSENKSKKKKSSRHKSIVLDGVNYENQDSEVVENDCKVDSKKRKKKRKRDRDSSN